MSTTTLYKKIIIIQEDNTYALKINITRNTQTASGIFFIQNKHVLGVATIIAIFQA